MGKRPGHSDSKGLPKKDATQEVPEALSLSSESELQSEDEESDLPEETDSEAGLPSDDLDSDGEELGSEASSDKDELDQAFLNVLEDEEDNRADIPAQPRDEYALWVYARS